MDYNAFEAELEDVAVEIDDALQQRAHVEATIAGAESFDVRAANEDLVRLRAKCEERKASLAEVDARLAELESKMQA